MAAADALREHVGEPDEKAQRDKYDEAHPGRKLEDMPGLTDEQKKNLGEVYGGRGRLTFATAPPGPTPPACTRAEITRAVV